jgi:hypothetical protein
MLLIVLIVLYVRKIIQSKFTIFIIEYSSKSKTKMTFKNLLNVLNGSPNPSTENNQNNPIIEELKM